MVRSLENGRCPCLQRKMYTKLTLKLWKSLERRENGTILYTSAWGLLYNLRSLVLVRSKFSLRNYQICLSLSCAFTFNYSSKEHLGEFGELEMLWHYFSLLFRYVLIAMEALDQLLMACHSQSIKPFVESFLHMVAKLLESGEPKLQVLGTNSVSKTIL